MIQEIHDSVVNGQRRQMVDQINEYGPADFFNEYEVFLDDLYIHTEAKYTDFKDAVLSYHNIMSRFV